MSPATALAEARSREHEMRDIIEQLYLQSGDGLSAHGPRHAAYDDIQHALRADSLLVEYYADHSAIWVFVLDGNTLVARKLPRNSNTTREASTAPRVASVRRCARASRT